MKFQKITYIKYISILYAIFVSVAFLIPLDSYLITEIIEKEKHPGNNISYFIHLIIFFIFYFLFFISYESKLKIFFVVVIYSIIIEFFQIFTSRGFQFTDIIFNLLGVLLSFVFVSFFFNKNFKVYKKFFKKRSKP